jgi:soluble cytochrome b562
MEPLGSAEAESSRHSRRLSGQDPEFSLLEKPSRAVSRTASRQSTRIHSPSQQLETESQHGNSDEEEEESTQETPRQPLRIRTPHVVISQPTSRKPRISEASEELEAAVEAVEAGIERAVGETIDQIQKATNHLQQFYSRHKPQEPEFEDTPEGFHQLVTAVDNLLAQVTPQKLLGDFPQTPEKVLTHNSPDPALTSAPHKGKAIDTAPEKARHWVEDYIPKIPKLSMPNVFGTPRPPSPPSRFANPAFSFISPTAPPPQSLFGKPRYSSQTAPAANPG